MSIGTTPFRPGEIFVTFKHGVSRERAAKLAQELGGELDIWMHEIKELMPRATIRVVPGQEAEKASAFRTLSEVEGAGLHEIAQLYET
ncbi:hypothetical protein FJY93_03605 [Candidatus Kaiserbacteria bacterium]|nr:hypothetical protein [Candidatus Kaiserbacteria bacterium]